MIKKIKCIALLLPLSFSLATAQEDKERWSLKECIDYAVQNNLTIKRGDNTIEQNRLNKETSKWARLPDLSASASHGWNWGRSASPIDNTYTTVQTANTNFGMNTAVPLFTGLELPNQYALSKLNLKAAYADLEKAKNDLAINVTSQYMQVLFNEELKGVAENQVSLSKEQLERGEAQLDIGKIAPADVAELRARVKQDEVIAVEADNKYQIALLDLSQLLELESPDNFAVIPITKGSDTDQLTPPEEIYRDAMLFKPEIQAAQYRAEGAIRSIRIARSGFMPKLSLSGSLSSGYYTMRGQSSQSFGSQLNNNFSKFVGFSLSIPLFNRMATINRVRSAKVDLFNQQIQLEDKKKTLYKEIQQAWYGATAAESKYISSQVALEANQTSFELTKEKYELGQTTNLSFNEAKINLMKAESDLLQAKYDYLFRLKLLNFYKGIPIE